MTLIVMAITALRVKHVATLMLLWRMSVKKPFKCFKDYQMKGNRDNCHSILIIIKFKLGIHWLKAVSVKKLLCVKFDHKSSWTLDQHVKSLCRIMKNQKLLLRLFVYEICEKNTNKWIPFLMHNPLISR